MCRPRVRFTIRGMMGIVALLAAIFGGSVWAWRWWAADRERPSYFRPLAIEADTLDLFAILGFRINGFEFSFSKHQQAVVTFIVRDHGQVIDRLSERLTLANSPSAYLTGPQHVKLIRIDPDQSSEKKTGRVRWLLTIGGARVLDTWEDRHEPTTNDSRDDGSVDPVVGLQPGKTYKVWQTRTRRMGRPDDGTVWPPPPPDFSIEMRLRIDPIQPAAQQAIYTFENIPVEEKAQEEGGPGRLEAVELPTVGPEN